uniref:Uncharacterized protein n=1 Tax=Lactuca sativa TaxID=4236 RepID=A0A9R1X080_LACSA|nr:hypothetical protein LSAT_V11C800402090 [Lactuca sativa]
MRVLEKLCKYRYCVNGNHNTVAMKYGSLVLTNMGGAKQILGQRTNQDYTESILVVSKCYTIVEYTCPLLDGYYKVLENDIYINVGIASIITLILVTTVLYTTWF